MPIQISVTIRDFELANNRTFITEVPGNPTKERDRLAAFKSLADMGARKVADVDICWSPASIIHSSIIEP